MQIKSVQKQIQRGFTLIEMIGVLAVIAILLALLVPKIFNAINEARINNAAVSYNTVKAACMEHYGKYGSFTANGAGVTVPATGETHFDQTILLPEGLIDKLFAVRIGDGLALNTLVRLQPGIAEATPSGGAAGAGNTAYNLDGSVGVPLNDASGAAWVLDAVISNVAEPDARALNDRIDGTAFPAVAIAAADL